jgi:hypothetical protein
LNQAAGAENGLAASSSSEISTPAATDPSPPVSVNPERGVHEPPRAEYAVRWDPSEGGLANAQEVLAFLNAPKKNGEAYEVRYFDLEPPASAPPDSITILRKRGKLGRKRVKLGGGTEICLKYRRTHPLVERWECPHDSSYEKVEEVDFSFVGTGMPNRVYSYSCTLIAQEPPPSLNAVPKKCASQFVRYQFEGFKIEEWTLPGENVKVEVSHSAKNTRAELAKFAEFVSKLRERGVKPLDQSKTELGSRCP